MPFPATPLGTVVQLKINNVWTNVVRDDAVTHILNNAKVNIKRGVLSMQDKCPPGICTWTWQDNNGRYNNENPRSPYYNLIPLNTPVRVYVPRSQVSLYTPATNTNGLRASCPDAAPLDVVGDLDIRIDVEPKAWTRYGLRNTTTVSSMHLASKYNAVQASWSFRLRESGALTFTWITAAVGVVTATSTVPIPFTGARLAFRVTLDVDNGAAGNTVTFYTAPSMTGTFTQLGAPVINAGITTVFSSNANIELGTINGGGDPNAVFVGSTNYLGRIFGFQFYNGIAGSKVAEADFTARAVGTTSFADGLGNTWTVNTALSEITDADYRFYGELSKPTLEPNRSKSGVGLDVKVNAEAGGIIRRLTANDTPLQSAIYLAFSANNPNGWWTGEDDSTADITTASAGTSDINPAVISNITFNGPDTGILGSAGVMVCAAGATFVGNAKTTTTTTESHFYGFFKLPSLPGAEVVIFSWYSSATAASYTFSASATAYFLRVFNAAGTQIATVSALFGTGADPTNWIAYHSRQIQNGGNVDCSHEWHAVGTDIYFTAGLATYAGTVGQHSKIIVQNKAGELTNMRFTHPMVSSKTGLTFFSGTPSVSVVNFARAYAGESADNRIKRIALLLGIDAYIFGEIGGTEPMGAQPLSSPMEVIYECVAVDGGMLKEATDQPVLEYYTRKSMQNQQGFLSITWAQLAEGLLATPDDTDRANDVILNRRGGGSARATLLFGPTSTQAPPNGINTVPDSPPDINNFRDSRLPELANQRLMIRSWPGSRYPAVKLDLHHPNFTANAALQLLAQRQDISNRLTITALPTFMPPDLLELLVTGVNEQLSNQNRSVTFALVPYGPYLTSEGSITTSTATNNIGYRASSHTIAGVVQQQLNAGITNSATSFAVKTLSGVLFDTTVTNLPIKIDGEFMTVGNITGTTSPQTFNSVTRGTVGSYAAAHNANAAVIVFPTLKARL